MKKLRVYIHSLAALLLLSALFSCAQNDGTGSLAIALPGASAARSITSSGTIPDPYSSDIEGYEVRVRDSRNEIVQKMSGLAPGSEVFIDGLLSDKYTISVLAYREASGSDGGSPNQINFSYDSVQFYNKTNVQVLAGQTSDASITLDDFENTGTYPVLHIYPPDSTAFTEGGGSLPASVTVTGGDVNFTYTGGGDTVGSLSSVYLVIIPSQLNGISNYYWHQKKETFLEPDFEYTFNVTVQNTGTGRIYTGSVTARVQQGNYGNQSEHAINITVR